MGKMRIVATAILLVLITVSVSRADNSKPIRVVVEGEEEAIATQKAAKATPVTVIKTDSKNTIEKLKKLAEKSTLEGDVLDGIISKMIDMEEQINQMKKEQDIKNLALLAAVLLLAVIAMIKRKK
jgi:hypothetical protein